MMAACFAAAAVPGAFSQANTMPDRAASQAGNAGAKLPEFEIVSVKPSNMKADGAAGLFTYPGGKIRATFCPLKYLILEAFDVQEFQIAGGPGWVNHDRYDIVAIPPASSKSSQLNPPSLKTPPDDEQRRMLQALLMDRFQLRFHRETRTGPVYVLTKGNGTPELRPAKDKDAFSWAGSIAAGPPGGDGLAGTNISMPQLAARMSSWLSRPVLDQTGLKGSYDFRYEYSSADPEDDPATSIIASIQGIGLRLKADKGPVEVIVIDHVERPSEN
jgi:uncharacterized protein (TIGR03435 family)